MKYAWAMIFIGAMGCLYIAMMEETCTKPIKIANMIVAGCKK